MVLGAELKHVSRSVLQGENGATKLPSLSILRTRHSQRGVQIVDRPDHFSRAVQRLVALVKILLGVDSLIWADHGERR